MVMRLLRRQLHNMVNRLGYTVTKNRSNRSGIYHDMDESFGPIYETTRHMTTSSVDRMYALYLAAQYISRSKIPGDIVECGVWQGGSSMIAALTLLGCGDRDRKLWLYDTYAGQPEPGETDFQANDGSDPHRRWAETQHGEINDWAFVPVEQVKANMLSTGYPEENLALIKGDVEETIPGDAPEKIALLRLDTDWKSSTYHELEHLYPRLSPGGVLIIDSYGWWTGCREATDQYLAENETQILLNRIDEAGRIGIKL